MRADVIGYILRDMGVVTPDELERAAAVQRDTRLTIGAALVSIGCASTSIVEAALRYQDAIRSGKKMRAALAKAAIANAALERNRSRARAVRDKTIEARQASDEYDAVTLEGDATPRER